MKTMLSFSSVTVCIIALFLLAPIAGAQDTEAAEDQDAVEDQESSQEDKIAAEKEMLEAKIAELEEQPVEYFGSPKNKRTRVGFYKYRLEMLLEDPDKYFSEPEEYEGNIKTPE
jgi:hypothetical protein